MPDTQTPPEKVTASHIVDEIRQSYKASGASQANSPAQQLSQSVTQIENKIREQQMFTESSLQQSLSQASTFVSDAQKIDTLLRTCQQLSGQIQQGTYNTPQVTQLLDQLKTQVYDQEVRTGAQATQSMQQAVSALAQAQSAMFQSGVFNEMTQIIKQCEQTIQQTSPGGTLH